MHVLTGPFDDVAARILADELDLGVGYFPAEMLADEPKLAFETLYKEEFVLTVHKSHPLARQQTVSLAKAAEFPLILFPGTSRLRRMHERLFLDAGLKPRIVMELENEEAIAEMIGLNMGIAFLSLRRAEQSGLPFLRIARTPVYCEVGMIFRRGGYTPRAVAEFVRMCREAIRAGKNS
jgi:DNA-binding transcriptional LysR family regulator